MLFAQQTNLQDGIWFHVTTVGFLILFKIVVVIVGYFIARLGYDLLIKGVTGQFKFQANFKGRKADFVSASPGLFFILMATVMIAIGILKDKPFQTKFQVDWEPAHKQVSSDLEPRKKPSLVDIPGQPGLTNQGSI